ncbi:MAG TPA: TlyA family RNA methyltransferase [Candidatus Polarisedimenticolia bacterium]|nr:TlyA family RNA methyltransferase [Candidatus Polarisedimenticolia bacterium]
MLRRSPGGKERLDRLLVDRGLARSRERAQALVLAGVVRVDGKPAGKPGVLVPAAADLTVVTPEHPYVGRGGVKLQGALEAFGIDPSGRVALDIGASTGGFTDCLLRRGAARVYALDVGAGQLDWALRRDGRVVVLEGRNARYLAPGDLPERVDLVVVDVSFISLRLILPVLPPVLLPQAEILALAKPQFEVGRGEVGPGGIVRDPVKQIAALEKVSAAAAVSGLAVLGACASPITGAEGNREFFLRLRAGGQGFRGEALTRLLGGIVHGA